LDLGDKTKIKKARCKTECLNSQTKEAKSLLLQTKTTMRLALISSLGITALKVAAAQEEGDHTTIFHSHFEIIVRQNVVYIETIEKLFI
jgi:hypothetical protein